MLSRIDKAGFALVGIVAVLVLALTCILFIA